MAITAGGLDITIYNSAERIHTDYYSGVANTMVTIVLRKKVQRELNTYPVNEREALICLLRSIHGDSYLDWISYKRDLEYYHVRVLLKPRRNPFVQQDLFDRNIFNPPEREPKPDIMGDD